MSFLNGLSKQVAPAIRAKGSNYYLWGKVVNLQGDAFKASAKVRGSFTYHVDAFRDEDALVVSCTCPYFESRQDTCKHIWALLLAADKKGFLEGDGNNAGLFIDIGVAAEEDEDSLEADWNNQNTWSARPKLEVFSPAKKTKKNKNRPTAQPPVPEWERQLKALHKEFTKIPEPYFSSNGWHAGRQILYVIEVSQTLEGNVISLSIPQRERKQNGDWGKPKYESINQSAISQLPDADDRKIITLLVGAGNQYGSFTNYSFGSYHSICRVTLSEHLAETVLPMICATDRCYLRPSLESELQPLVWDEGPPWSFLIKMAKTEDGSAYRLTGHLRRAEETADLLSPPLIVTNFIFWHDRVSRFSLEGSFNWVGQFRRIPQMVFPLKEKGAWLQQLLRLPNLPPFEWPDDLQILETQGVPRPRLRVQPIKDAWQSNKYLEGILSFDYAGQIAVPSEPGPLYRPETNQLMRRDSNAEKMAQERLFLLGFSQRQQYNQAARLELKTLQLGRVVGQLLAEGWHVEAEGKLFRGSGAIAIEVTTGIDWFELHGKVQFDDLHVGLPELLTALKKGENTVVLGDGSLGMIPETWLKKYGLLAGMGKAENGHIKFARNQLGLLDALLAAQPEARCDAAFSKIRKELQNFEGIKAADPPKEFQGELRGYQREGLGWLHFLRRFGFGGCLADDMGLGKTVQVLALLDARRQEIRKTMPNLVVVPKSLIFNWQAEAARFTPHLRVLNHTGMARKKPGDHFNEYDLILTTYGTLRRDALEFKDFLFDYCILDEAQAIKNAKSESAKAARLLQANYRLTVTGTPIENHLGELWSQFDFLNPGMLGQASVFQLAGARAPEPETRELLAKALRPFLLRRTKEQVAKDLPQKTEQTLFAEMEPNQRKLYDELRDHYRLSLLGKIERDGIAKSKIQILEALLRLRQAACHPGLIDKKRCAEPSAKLDLLLPQLKEVLEEGHKALVFSQFTSMLAILRERLDQDNVVYEYLDGRTRDRGEKVTRFQTDPDCKLFLISLKAGGLGLNLTAAEYVFLLDPWWNPAVEAQAIDRTHRIGQTCAVFAYRLIVKDTVEEKVLELQGKKRALADAILNADNSLIRTLCREDLEMLLS